MPFDLESAKPVESSGEKTGFDLESAKPVETPAKKAEPQSPKKVEPEGPGFFSRLGTELKSIPGRIKTTLDEQSDISNRGWGERKPGTSPHSMSGGPAGLKPEFVGGVGTGVKTAGKALIGALEVPVTLGAGAVMAGAGGVAGAGRAVYNIASGEGVGPSLEKGGETASKVMHASYEPKTDMGKIGMQMVTAPLVGASRVGSAVGASAGRVLGNEAAGETIGENLPALAMSGKAVKDLGGAYKTAGARAELSQSQKAIAKAQEAGFKTTPGEANPSLLNSIVESGAGSGLNPKLALKNQKVASEKLRSAFGKDKNAEMTPEVWNDIRAEAGKPYKDLKDFGGPIKLDDKYRQQIGELDKHLKIVQKEFPGLAENPTIKNLKDSLLDKPTAPRNKPSPAEAIRSRSSLSDKSGLPPLPTVKTAEGIVDAIKHLRSDATRMFRSTDKDVVAAGFANRKGADALESLLERHMEKNMAADKFAEWKKGRQTIAMSHDAEAATNPVTGDVNPTALGRMLKKGRPLSGELREIAEASLAMPSTVRDTSRISPGGGLHTSDVGLIGILAAGAHFPKHLALGLVRPAAKGIASSDTYQSLAAKPKGKATGQFPMKSATAALMADSAAKKSLDPEDM